MENNKKNGKKTNKEKRVLIGALCVAAVMIAGSTFAWFTSQDEVTNRLSANADYNVSIVESFTPPKNWIPGQLVNKEVYATNTGNIGAFVEQDVSGVLTITVEKPVTTWDADCVELTEAERYSMEAGSYLAFKPDGSTKVLGEQAVSITPSSTDPNAYTEGATDFTPDVDGLYVFRRSIGVDSITRAETFEYAGYEYKNGKYYKVELTSVTPDTTADFAADGVSNDGNLTAATCSYFKDVTEVLDPTALEYDAANNRLVASYDTGIVNSAFTDLESAAARFDAANHNVEYLTQLVAKATAENNTNTGDTSAASDALDTAQTNLNNALTAQQQAADALLTTTTAFNNATAAKNAAQSAYDASKTKLFGEGGSASNAQDDSLKKIYDDATAEKNAWNTNNPNQKAAFEAEVEAWLGTNPDGVTHTSLNTLTVEELKKFNPSPESHELYQLTAAELIAKTNYENEMKKAYGKTDGSEDTNGYTNDSLYGVLQAAIADLGDASNGKTKDYNDAVQAKQDADADVTAKQTAYNNALNDYRTAVGNNTATAATLAELQAQLVAANAELAAASDAYDAATATAGSATSATDVLKININLSDNVVTAGGVADKWQLLPNPIADNVAKFYYTSILGAGATSSQLIKSVELDSSATQDMYKSFDFDLNVALKSAQITYADDNTTILPTAANETLDANATLTTPTSEASPVTWTEKPASSSATDPDPAGP